MVLFALNGCAPMNCCTNGNCSSYCDCGSSPCYDDSCYDCGPCKCKICRAGGCCPLALRKHELRIAIGPDAVRYKPEMPPEFLPVPPRPVFANVNMDAPTEARGSVESGYGPYFTIEGRD